MLKYLFFDFGGCIDAPGIHTRTLFWDALGEVSGADRESFQEAYSQADKLMMSSGVARNLNLRDFNRLNGTLIAQSLKVNPAQFREGCDEVTSKMDSYIKHSKKALEPLRARYTLGVISNFTGNLELIMGEYGIRDYFHSVTESFYAGASKPDLKIFRDALAKQAHPPSECLYIGDNPVNDISPARSLGMKTVLIHAPGKKRECGADGYLSDLLDLPALIQRM